jgi:Zn ribbon nucleic-acid-binding protein
MRSKIGDLYPSPEYPDLDAADYEPPSYDLDDEVYAYEQHCCDQCGHTYASANEEDLGFCRYCADDTDENQVANQGYRRPVTANTQPDLCPRCGAKNPEVAWQTYMVTEPTLVVQCQECGFHSYGVAKSRRAGRKDWELRKVVIAEWNQLAR